VLFRSHVMEDRYVTLADASTLGGMLNVPVTLTKLRPEHDVAILSMHVTRPDETSALAEILQPQVVIFDLRGCESLQSFEDSEHYIREMAHLLPSLPEDGLLVMDAGDPNANLLMEYVPPHVQVKTAGVETFGADLLALNVKVGAERIGFDLRYGSERLYGRWSPVLGQHHLPALLNALLVGQAFGLSLTDGLQRLTDPPITPGHMTALRGLNDSLLIDNTDFATAVAATAALDWLESVAEENNRITLVVADLDEIDHEDNSETYRDIGLRAATIADVIITQGVGASSVARAALDRGKSTRAVHMTFSHRDVLDALEELQLGSKDIVLVVGGSFMQMEHIVRSLLHDDSDSTQLVRQNVEVTPSRMMLRARPSWVEVDADAIADNARAIKSSIGNDVTLMAVVKANGYGHGAALVAQTALNNGAEYLGVASLEEALQLREAGIQAPILMLTYFPPEAVSQAIRLNLTATVFDLETARRYHQAAFGASQPLKVHVKLDTGMGRLGFFAEETSQIFRRLRPLTNLRVEGVYTHFAIADDDPGFTAEQVEIFKEALLPLRAAGMNIRYIHAANSPGVLGGEDNFFSMVRPGLLLYGLNPSENLSMLEGMRPALSWKTTILQVRDFPPGYPIGYGNTYYTKGHERIAILPVGYADGFRRSPQTWQYVLVRGQRAPVVGRVSMEKCAINVTDIPDVYAGDEVVLLGAQGDEIITAEMVAEWLGTINYEVVTTILPRAARL